MTVTDPILVLGATGGQGSAVVHALLHAGQPVRALVRDATTRAAHRLADQGIQVAAGDFTDRGSLAAAMRDTSAAYALTTPFESGVDAEITQGQAIIDAAAKAGLPHLVFASVASADRDTGVPHFESKARVERLLAASGLVYTIVAPSYFFDNVLGGLDDLLGGRLVLPLPADRPLQQLARADLGQVAAHVLAHPAEFAGARIEVAGDDPTPARMAQACTAALSRPVRHEQVPISASNPDMAAMWRFLQREGYQVDIPALHRRFPSLPWTSFADWARQTLVR